MEDTGDYINSAPSSEVSVSVRISSISSSRLETHLFCNFESSSRLEVLPVPKFFTFGSTSRLEASLYTSSSHLEQLCIITKLWRNIDLDLTTCTAYQPLRKIYHRITLWCSIIARMVMSLWSLPCIASYYCI